jgi:hypothetical protein
MHIARPGPLPLLFAIGAALAALAGLSCSKDDIPTTPPPPFLITYVAVSKFVSPPTTTILHRDSTYLIRFSVDYTLNPDTDANRSLFTVFADVAEFAEADTLVDVIGFIPFPFPDLTASSGTVTDSILFTVPASGQPFLRVIAGVARKTASTFNFRSGPRWSVQ